MGSREEELARLERELEELKARRPEHCHGTNGFVGVHSASPELWAKVEELEDRIAKLKAQEGASREAEK